MITICFLINALYKIPETDVPVNHKEKRSIMILSALKYETTSIHIKKKTE